MQQQQPRARARPNGLHASLRLHLLRPPGCVHLCSSSTTAPRLRHFATTAAAAALPKNARAAGSAAALELSLLMLLQENLKRRAGRCLVPPAQLLQAPKLAARAPFALALLATPSDGDGGSGDGSARVVLYANNAAQALLPPRPSGDGDDLWLVRAPPDVEALWRAWPAAADDGGEQQCELLRGAAWRPTDDDALSVDELLVCRVLAPNDTDVATALLFARWRFDADGALGAPGSPRVALDEVPDAAALAAAAGAVRGHADAVRVLKQVQGLGNKDARVVGAVAKLAALKLELARLEGLAAALGGDDGRDGGGDGSLLLSLLPAVPAAAEAGTGGGGNSG